MQTKAGDVLEIYLYKSFASLCFITLRGIVLSAAKLDQDLSYEVLDQIKILLIITFKNIFSCKHISTHKIFHRIIFSQFM